MLSVSESRRESLKLPLNRSLSEPGPGSTNVIVVTSSSAPSKKCKLEETVSLPASPNSDPAIVFRTVIKAIRVMEVGELSRRIVENEQTQNRSFLILDCRPFLAFNCGHIAGSVNVNCSDRFNRKRLQVGRATLADLTPSNEAKDLIRRRTCREVIVCDDSTADLDNLHSNHPLFLVLSALWADNRDPVVLKGGWREFNKHYAHLCESSTVQSPTIIGCDSMSCDPSLNEPDIENTPATRVLPFLFLGNERDAADLKGLLDLRITCILNVTAHLPGYHEEQGIKYKRLPASDSGHQNLKQYFDEAFEFI
uniref:Rhodanese domain-containing protein n=1 Tax=Strigamia maritima TaxID=126957 RepID=T1ITQ4_STRMM